MNTGPTKPSDGADFEEAVQSLFDIEPDDEDEEEDDDEDEEDDT